MKKIDSGLRCGRKVICNNIHYCNNMFSKGFGLMFRSKDSVKDVAWIFTFGKPRIVSLTMWFVFFPIEAIFLDDKKKIVEIASLRPWGFYNPSKISNYCIELELGTVKNFGLKVGDKLIFS